MARTLISTTGWTSLGTTTTDELFAFEGGDVRLFIGSTAGIPFKDGVQIEPVEKIVIPSGLAVSAWAEVDGVYGMNIPFGV